MSASSELVTVEEAAALMQISESRVRAKLRSGELPGVRMGKRLWMIQRLHIMCRDQLRSPAGRPLSPERAWAEIIDLSADPLHPGRYRHRGRVLRFHANNRRVLDAGAALGGVVSGQHSGVYWLEQIEAAGVDVSIPMLDHHQDVYLPASSEHELGDHCLRKQRGDGTAVVRLVPDHVWPTVRESAAAPTPCSNGMPLAPPLAASLDMWAHAEARSADAAAEIAEWIKVVERSAVS